ncbi:hypothetical protein EV121DRAFT_295176 [Schizophyllum commune]
MVYTTSLSANAEQAIAVIVAETLAVDAHDALVVVPPPAPRRAPTCCPPPDPILPTPFPPRCPALCHPDARAPRVPTLRTTARPDLRSPSHVHPRGRPRSRFRQMPKTHRTRIAAQRAVARLLAAPLREPAVGLRALGDCRARELARRMAPRSPWHLHAPTRMPPMCSSPHSIPAAQQEAALLPRSTTSRTCTSMRGVGGVLLALAGLRRRRHSDDTPSLALRHLPRARLVTLRMVCAVRTHPSWPRSPTNRHRVT